MDLTAAARASIEQVGAVSRKISATMTEAVRDSKAVAYLLESSAGQQKLLADTKQVASALQKVRISASPS
jgi:ribosome maturation factor RimP